MSADCRSCTIGFLGPAEPLAAELEEAEPCWRVGLLFCAAAAAPVVGSESCEGSGIFAGNGAGGAPGPDEAMAGAVPLCGGFDAAPLESEAAGIPTLASAGWVLTGDVCFRLEAWSA